MDDRHDPAGRGPNSANDPLRARNDEEAIGALRYLVVEFFPHAMHHKKTQPARIDGHYAEKEMAQGVAELWAENPVHEESRIVVAEIVYEAKEPKHWAERWKE